LAPSSLRHKIRDFFLQLNPCGNSPYVTSSHILSDERMGFSLMNRLHLFKCTYRTYNVIENSSFCTTYTSSVSSDFAEHIMLMLCILCYNGSLVIWKVVSLTNVKFSPLIFYMSGFALSYTTNVFILMILYDFYLLTAQFCLISVYIYIYNGRLKVVCKSQTSAHLGKFPMMLRPLFCRHCNFKR
jgi:hypothetical protein